MPENLDAKPPLVGVILAGGLSRRMDGREKSMLELAGEPLIAHAIRRLSPQVDHLLVNANGDAQRFDQFALPVIADTVEGYAGPLAGALTAMRWARKEIPAARNILTAAADTPFFPEDLAKKLMGDTNRDQRITFARSNGRRHPVFALWPVALADDLEKFLLEEQGRKVLLFAERYPLDEVDFGNIVENDPATDPFFNINHPYDLQLAQELARKLANKRLDDYPGNHARQP